MTVVYVVLGAVVAGGAWYVDLRWHPWKPCRSCHGRTRNAGSRPAAWGDHHCRRCGGKGKVRRIGAGEES
jgi:DnaJ-class molecular chaperone